VDEEEAVSTVVQAFEDGLFLVIMDGEEKKELDGEVFLKVDSNLVFIRLTMISGKFF
jgi:hypothetical protein